MAKDHFAVSRIRTACGAKLNKEGRVSAWVVLEPRRVTCGTCKIRLAAGVMVNDPETGTVLFKKWPWPILPPGA